MRDFNRVRKDFRHQDVMICDLCVVEIRILGCWSVTVEVSGRQLKMLLTFHHSFVFSLNSEFTFCLFVCFFAASIPRGRFQSSEDLNG